MARKIRDVSQIRLFWKILPPSSGKFYFSVLKMKKAVSSRTSATIYQTTRSNIPVNSNIHCYQFVSNIPTLTMSVFITTCYVQGLRMEEAAFTYLRMAKWKADGG
jgi:hypothetical protein